MNYLSYINAKDCLLSIQDKLTPDDQKLRSDYLLQLTGVDFFDDSLLSDYDIDSPEKAKCHFHFGLLLAYVITKSKFVEKQLFDNYEFNANDFLNFVSLLGFYSLQKPKELYKLIIEEAKTIGFSKVLSESSGCCYDYEVAEVEFFNCLVSCTIEVVSLCLKYVDTDKESKQILKNCVLDKNKDLFITTLIKSKADYNHVATVLFFFTSISSMIKMCAHWLGIEKGGAGNNTNDYISVYDVLFDSNSINMPNNQRILVQLISPWEKQDSEPDLLQDWFAAYATIAATDAFFLSLHNYISSVASDITAVIKATDFIQNDPRLKKLYYLITSKRIDLIDYTPLELKTLVNFKNKYINRLILPKSIGGKKDVKEYFLSNKNGVDEDYCWNLYEKLVEYNLLDYNLETLSSFVYRMDKHYNCEEEPTKITWRGSNITELYNLVYWFAGGVDTRLWNKMGRFFIDSNGKEINTIGITGQAKSLTVRMEKIIKEFTAEFGE